MGACATNVVPVCEHRQLVFAGILPKRVKADRVDKTGA